MHASVGVVLDVFEPHVAFLGPCYERAIDACWAVVHTNSLWLSTPLNDLA